MTNRLLSAAAMAVGCLLFAGSASSQQPTNAAVTPLPSLISSARSTLSPTEMSASHLYLNRSYPEVALIDLTEESNHDDLGWPSGPGSLSDLRLCNEIELPIEEPSVATPVLDVPFSLAFIQVW